MEIDPELVGRAIAEVSKRRTNYEYFFRNLDSSDWIEPLLARGLFSEPPPQEESEQGINAPSWPPSQYLARMAAKAPQKTFDVLVTISTSNERIHEDFVDAALLLPAPLAHQLAQREIDWLSQSRRLYFGLSAKLVQLITRLANDGRIDLAINLTEQLFSTSGRVGDGAGLAATVGPAKLSDWEFSHLLEQAIPAIERVDPSTTLQYLVRALKHALELSRSSDPEDRDDFSQVWRPRLEADDRDERDVLQALTSALRDTANAARRNSSMTDNQIFRVLSIGNFPIFRRVMAYVISNSPTADVATTEATLLEREDFFAPEPSSEYRELLSQQFPNISERARAVLFSWIDEGPDLAEYESWLNPDSILPADRAAATNEYVGRWKIRRLHLVRESAPIEWKEKYSELVSRFGEAEFVTSFEITTWIGPESPANADSLAELSDGELVSLLLTYNASSSEPFGPSPEGLARELGQLAERNPERIAQIASDLLDVRPVYVQWALIGLTKALRDGHSVSWPSLVRLLQHAVSSDAAGSGEPQDEDTGQWAWVRREVASLLEAGLQADERSVPLQLRAKIWELLDSLLKDPEPTAEYERSYGGSNMDPVMLALNTTRGRAMHAVVAYALWVRRQLNDSSTPDLHSKSGLAEMPEVREALDRHLDPGIDSSLAVRAVYGQRFPLLAALDEGWAITAAGNVFPPGPESPPLGEAGWCSYIIYCRPYNSMIRILRAQYLTAVERGSRAYQDWNWLGGGSGAPAERLASHLLSYYLRGILSLSESDRIIERLFELSSAEVRAAAIEFLGRSLRAMPAIEESVRERAQNLWEWRIQQMAVIDDRAEASSFSWWADCEALDPEWRLTQIERILLVGATLQPESVALDALDELSEFSPERSVKALRALLVKYREGWTIHAYSEKVHRILNTALESSDVRAQARAEDTIHWLGSLGFHEFRPLLKPRTS